VKILCLFRFHEILGTALDSSGALVRSAYQILINWSLAFTCLSSSDQDRDSGILEPFPLTLG